MTNLRMWTTTMDCAVTRETRCLGEIHHVVRRLYIIRLLQIIRVYKEMSCDLVFVIFDVQTARITSRISLVLPENSLRVRLAPII